MVGTIVGVKVGSGVNVMVGSRVWVGGGVTEGCSVSVDIRVGIAVGASGEAQAENISRDINTMVGSRNLFKTNSLESTGKLHEAGA